MTSYRGAQKQEEPDYDSYEDKYANSIVFRYVNFGKSWGARRIVAGIFHFADLGKAGQKAGCIDS